MMIEFKDKEMRLALALALPMIAAALMFISYAGTITDPEVKRRLEEDEKRALMFHANNVYRQQKWIFDKFKLYDETMVELEKAILNGLNDKYSTEFWQKVRAKNEAERELEEAILEGAFRGK